MKIKVYGDNENYLIRFKISKITVKKFFLKYSLAFVSWIKDHFVKNITFHQNFCEEICIVNTKLKWKFFTRKE